MLSVERGQGEFQRVSLIPTMIFTLLVVWYADSVYNIEVGCNSCYKRMKQNLEDVGGSRLGRLKQKIRRAEDADVRLYQEYFEPTGSIYSEHDFHRRFRISMRLFFRLVDEISEYDSYFVQKKYAAGKLGLNAIQKCATAVQILGYSMTPDALDQYFKIAESTTREAFKRFVKAIQGFYNSRYLKKPTRENILQQMQINERRGWPEMFASIDKMHYQWNNCYVAWQRHYQNKDHNRNIVLEAVTDKSLWL